MATSSSVSIPDGERLQDPARQQIFAAITAAGLTLKQASRALGRNDAYLQQYLYRGSPKRLPEELRHQLAALLAVDHHSLVPATDVAANARSTTDPTVPFFPVHASAGGGALNRSENQDGHFSFPQAVLRGITSSPQAELRMITITGDSMTPTLEHGDIVMVDCAQTWPSPPGIFILDDGVGLVAKRLDLIASGTSTTGRMHHLQITSENTQYARYQRDIDEVHIVGRVVWFARAL